VVLGIGLIVAGVVVIAVARTFADAFGIDGNTSAMTRFLGFGDDVASRYRRWSTAVLVGLVCIGLGVARLFY
jgi:hypothetical protein